MNRFGKAIGIIAGIVFIGFIGRCVYQVLCISCTTPPIKTYTYEGSMDKFEYEFKKFAASQPNMSLKISWRDSSDNRSARDFILQSNNHSNNIKYDLTVYDFNGMTKVDLDDVYNESQKIGGNNIDSVGVKELFDGFKNEFLIRLKKDQNIILKPDFF